jgi:hypothetical protein
MFTAISVTKTFMRAAALIKIFKSRWLYGVGKLEKV